MDRSTLGLQVGERVRELRTRAGLTQEDLAVRLRMLGHDLHSTAITRIEKGKRGVLVDDLVALAVALDVSPNRLMLPAEADDEEVGLTPATVAAARTAWRWADGDDPLPADLWNPAALDVERTRRFRRENRPHDPPGDMSLSEAEEHRDVLQEVVRAVQAAEDAGVPRASIFDYVSLMDSVRDLARVTKERRS